MWAYRDADRPKSKSDSLNKLQDSVSAVPLFALSSNYLRHVLVLQSFAPNPLAAG